MRSSDCVFTGSNCTRVWKSRHHVGRIKAFHSESDQATLQWLLIKDRDTEPGIGREEAQRSGERQKDRQLSHENCTLSKLSEERHCEKGTVRPQHLKSGGGKIESHECVDRFIRNLTPSSHSQDIIIFYCRQKVLTAVMLILEKKTVHTEMKHSADVGR